MAVRVDVDELVEELRSAVADAFAGARLDEVEAVCADALDTAAILDGEDAEMLRDVAKVAARVAFRSKARDPRVRMKVLVGLRGSER